jgi:hypothetical protein
MSTTISQDQIDKFHTYHICRKNTSSGVWCSGVQSSLTKQMWWCRAGYSSRKCSYQKSQQGHHPLPIKGPNYHKKNLNFHRRWYNSTNLFHNSMKTKIEGQTECVVCSQLSCWPCALLVFMPDNGRMENWGFGSWVDRVFLVSSCLCVQAIITG